MAPKFCAAVVLVALAGCGQDPSSEPLVIDGQPCVIALDVDRTLCGREAAAHCASARYSRAEDQVMCRRVTAR